MVGRATGVDLVFVPYKGGGPLVADLVAGQVPAGIGLVSEMVQQHRSGRLRMLAVFGPQRSSAAPEVPTFDELAFAGMDGGMGWHAFHTTAGTPRATIDRLSAAIGAAIRTPEINERLLALGLEPVGSTPEELARRVAEDTARWGPAIRASGFRAEE
jgi:tripartite-type tricarboxylate transporter receptor subunit TctC